MATSTSHVEPVAHEIHLSATLARLLQSTLVILLPVVIVLSVVRLLATDQYLMIEYNRSDFPSDQYGFDYADRLIFASAAVSYMRDGLSLNALSDLQWQGQPVYNERELGHMVDVQHVFQAASLVWVLTLSIILLAVTWLFYASDTLVRLVPEKFWFDTALSLAGLSLVGGLLIALIGWRLQKHFSASVKS